MNILLGCLLLGFSMIAHAEDNMTLNVNSNDPSFAVTLPANPTTGYQWTVVDYDKSLLKLVSSIYQKPQTKLIGAGGQMQFTFTLNSGKNYPETTQMKFKYARSWETKGATLKNVVINFSAH